MDRAQSGDEKNGVICLVIMFTSKVIVIKMSKMADSFSCRWQLKNSRFGQMHMKNPTEFFQEWYALGLLLSQQKKYWKLASSRVDILLITVPLEFNNP